MENLNILTLNILVLCSLILGSYLTFFSVYDFTSVKKIKYFLQFSFGFIFVFLSYYIGDSDLKTEANTYEINLRVNRLDIYRTNYYNKRVVDDSIIFDKKIVTVKCKMLETYSSCLMRFKNNELEILDRNNKDSALKSFELTPDMKIAAVSDSEILVSDKGKGQQVRMRILADVHNP